VPQPHEYVPAFRRVAGVNDTAHLVHGHPLEHARQAMAVGAMEMSDADAGGRLARRAENHQLTVGHDTRP
jgi:hypothetical protein